MCKHQQAGKKYITLAKQREVTTNGMEENVGPCLGQMMKDESGKINEGQVIESNVENFLFILRAMESH